MTQNLTHKSLEKFKQFEAEYIITRVEAKDSNILVYYIYNDFLIKCI